MYDRTCIIQHLYSLLLARLYLFMALLNYHVDGVHFFIVWPSYSYYEYAVGNGLAVTFPLVLCVVPFMFATNGVRE